MSRMPHSRHWPARPQRGFTLVEMAVVVMILGLLVALALPGYRKINIKAQATAATNDLRTFATAFGNANLQNSGWPTDTGVPGMIPPEMVNALSLTFTKNTPIGGKYLWISNSTTKAAVAITTDGSSVMSSDVELLEMVDRLLDDGDLSTGNLQQVGPALVYVIEK